MMLRDDLNGAIENIILMMCVSFVNFTLLHCAAIAKFRRNTKLFNVQMDSFDESNAFINDSKFID